MFSRRLATSLVLVTAASGPLATGAEQPGARRLKAASSAVAAGSQLKLKSPEAAPRHSLTSEAKGRAFAAAGSPEKVFTAECDDAAGPEVVQALTVDDHAESAEQNPFAGRRLRATPAAVAFPFYQDEDVEAPAGLPNYEAEDAQPLTMDQAERETPPAPSTQLRPISAINPFHDYAPDGEPCAHLCPPDADCPHDPSLECPEEGPFYSATPPGRAFGQVQYLWTASNLYHNPLYFEDVGLERYGHVKRNEVVQQVWSLGKFGAQLIGLPYQMALDNPHDCRYALGYYQPGDCAPPMTYQAPLNAKAAVTAGAFYTGAAFIIP